jgi:ERCC4-related helicase
MTSNGVALTPGMRVLCRDAEWLVTRVDPSDYTNTHFAVHCVGGDDLVRGHEAVFLTQLDAIEPVDPRTTTLVEDGSSGYRLAKLFLEAQLRQMPATGVEPDLVGMGVFKPMPFQVQTVAWALHQLRPRLLLADAVGLGKTIQVGMILSELMRRGRANRLLVLAKKSMLTQFQSELWNRFGIPLVRLDSIGIAKLRLRIPANKNPFEVYHRIIISIDTLKNVGSYRHFLENTRWDCVVIDEAHNVAGASVPERHLSHRLARLLSRRTDSMLLTTATPHNGKRETFGRLITLLDPSVMPDPELREYTADDVRGFFFMRFKEDVRADAGENLTDRLLVPLADTTIDATPHEEHVYQILADMRQAALASQQSDTPWAQHALLQYGLYKQFLSSPESCRKTVQKRRETVSAADFTSPELPHLDRLDAALAGLALCHSSRYRLLTQHLRALGWDGAPASPRVLVFTEYRETQDALAAALAQDFRLRYSARFEDQPTQVLATVHGSCPDVHLMKIVEAFSTGSAPIRLLLATDVASEGINLHHECHHIIHYDLPWSIITLIQRNGRIDRFGQTKNPVLRYLMVHTQQELLAGDAAIFQRLVAKVEEINLATRSGESALKLYDPEAEERYIAEHGLLRGNVNVLEQPATTAASEAAELEALLQQANPVHHEDYLRFLLGETEEAPTVSEVTPEAGQPSRLRLYDDKRFVLEGYRFLREQNPDYLEIEETGHLMILTAPTDLRRRLGASDERGDVVFGATAIPVEAWPDHHQFRLTDNPEQVELAIKAARNTSGYWSREMLCTDQHPILQWITERLLMLMRRGECPLILSRYLEPGELCFCCIGQVSSRTGVPLVVDAHAIAFHKGGSVQQRLLREALAAAGFDRLVNTGRQGNIEAVRLLIPAAVDASLAHLKQRRMERERQLIPLLRAEECRLRQWRNRRHELLETRIAHLGALHPRARRYRKDLEEVDAYVRDRQENWRDTHFTASQEPSTRVVLVIEGTH